LIHLRLIDAGFGSYEEVRKLDARVVLQALNFMKFKTDYERAYMEINK